MRRVRLIVLDTAGKVSTHWSSIRRTIICSSPRMGAMAAWLMCGGREGDTSRRERMGWVRRH
jgi:hypothetical protein